MGQLDKELDAYVAGRLQAAEGGRAQALYDLGLLYSTGQGVELDLVQAHKFFNLAAVKGVERAVVDRAEIADELGSTEVAEAQRQAREWLSCH